MADAVPLWLHLAAVPALRSIGDEAARLRATEVMVRRFNVLAWSAMGLIILTGISNVFDRGEEFAFDYDFRYAWVLTAKLGLVALTIALTALHSFVIGPRLLAAQAGNPGNAAVVSALRRRSVMVSAVNLLAALGILFLAALLQQPFVSVRV